MGKTPLEIEDLDDLEGAQNVFKSGGCVSHLEPTHTFYEISKSAKMTEIVPFWHFSARNLTLHGG